jgi:Bardet-Biedl syndrome 7 protein
MNMWLSLCLADTPQHASEEGNIIYYKSLFTGSYLICEYGKGNAVIKSDSITTLTIINDSIVKSASVRKTVIDVSFELEDECTFSLLKLLHPKIQELYELKQKADLIETIKELKLQQEQEVLSGEKTFELPEEYELIAKNAERIGKEQKSQPKKLEYIYGIIVDLFMDRAKALGIQNAESKISALEHCLHKYDYQELTNFFKSFK